MCFQGNCVCSKIKGTFKTGDGTTQGSCSSPLHTCNSNGQCAECSFDSQCSGLSNKCVNSKCVCGNSHAPCNSTISNICDNGTCRCGLNDQCSTKFEVRPLQFNGQDVTECQKTGTNRCEEKSYDEPGYCGCFWSNGCKVWRSEQEVCQQISKYYNPLFIRDRIKYQENGIEKPAWYCDDIFGDRIGEYHCLGIKNSKV